MQHELRVDRACLCRRRRRHGLGRTQPLVRGGERTQERLPPSDLLGRRVVRREPLALVPGAPGGQHELVPELEPVARRGARGELVAFVRGAQAAQHGAVRLLEALECRRIRVAHHLRHRLHGEEPVLALAAPGAERTRELQLTATEPRRGDAEVVERDRLGVQRALGVLDQRHKDAAEAGEQQRRRGPLGLEHEHHKVLEQVVHGGRIRELLRVLGRLRLGGPLRQVHGDGAGQRIDTLLARLRRRRAARVRAGVPAGALAGALDPARGAHLVGGALLRRRLEQLEQQRRGGEDGAPVRQAKVALPLPRVGEAQQREEQLAQHPVPLLGVVSKDAAQQVERREPQRAQHVGVRKQGLGRAAGRPCRRRAFPAGGRRRLLHKEGAEREVYAAYQQGLGERDGAHAEQVLEVHEHFADVVKVRHEQLVERARNAAAPREARREAAHRRGGRRAGHFGARFDEREQERVHRRLGAPQTLLDDLLGKEELGQLLVRQDAQHTLRGEQGRCARPDAGA